MSVVLSGITKRFGKKTVIEDFSLDLDKGSRIALVSPSGSGKTTLFRIIAGLEKRFDGERRVDGKVALMFQEDRLFDRVSVLDNVTAVSERDPEIAKELLSSLGLSDAMEMYPTALSGGMKRRVALARALFFDGDVVLLDECFTGLDDETKKVVASVINRETENKTLILISHDSEDAELLNCTSMILKNGFIK